MEEVLEVEKRGHKTPPARKKVMSRPPTKVPNEMSTEMAVEQELKTDDDDDNDMDRADSSTSSFDKFHQQVPNSNPPS
jgi:hypothetical protein